MMFFCSAWAIECTQQRKCTQISYSGYEVNCDGWGWVKGQNRTVWGNLCNTLSIRRRGKIVDTVSPKQMESAICPYLCRNPKGGNGIAYKIENKKISYESCWC